MYAGYKLRNAFFSITPVRLACVLNISLFWPIGLTHSRIYIGVSELLMVVFSVLYVEFVRDTHTLLSNFTEYAFFPLQAKEGLVALLECCFTNF